MLAKLEYTLPEEQEEFDNAFNGWKYKLILFELDNKLKNKLEYSTDISDSEFAIYSNIRKELNGFVNAYNLTIF